MDKAVEEFEIEGHILLRLGNTGTRNFFIKDSTILEMFLQTTS